MAAILSAWQASVQLLATSFGTLSSEDSRESTQTCFREYCLSKLSQLIEQRRSRLFRHDNYEFHSSQRRADEQLARHQPIEGIEVDFREDDTRVPTGT